MRHPQVKVSSKLLYRRVVVRMINSCHRIIGHLIPRLLRPCRKNHILVKDGRRLEALKFPKHRFFIHTADIGSKKTLNTESFHILYSLYLRLFSVVKASGKHFVKGTVLRTKLSCVYLGDTIVPRKSRKQFFCELFIRRHRIIGHR